MRCDGKRVHDDEPMYEMIPQFLTKRYDAMNMVTVDIPSQPLREYMNRKRHENVPVSHLALIMTAYAKTALEFPKLNRFVSGTRRLYQRNDFTVAMVVLRQDGEGTMSKLSIAPEDTIFSVQEKINAYIEANRQHDSNKLDKVLKVLLRLGILTDLVGFLLRFGDKHGLLPRALVDASPFHASLLISNLASIRTNHIYHHVYEFGTTGVAITMGNPRMVAKKAGDAAAFERTIPLGIVMDERIASGWYFSQAFARLKRYLREPDLLEIPIGMNVTNA